MTFYRSILVGAVLICSSVAAEVINHPGTPINVTRNLTYSELGPGKSMQLDLYRPVGASEPLPAIVCIHGGAWRQGNRRNLSRLATELASRGYVVAAISYRLSGEAKFPAQIHDCKAAVRWLRAHAKEYGIDDRYIDAVGHSAGGHLAALLATSGGVGELEGVGNLEYSSRIQCAVAMGAQADLETDRIRQVSKSPEEDFYPQFLGGTLEQCPTVYRLASPVAHLNPSDPPLAFVTGEKDDLSTRAAEPQKMLRALGIPTSLLILPGQPHNFLQNEPAFKEASDFCAEFFGRYLKVQL